MPRPSSWLRQLGTAALASGPLHRISQFKRKYDARTIRAKRPAVGNEERTRSEPVTTAADVRVDYRSRRRRVSPRVRRVANKFRKRVLRVTDKEQSPVKVVLTGAGASSCALNSQGVIMSGGFFLNTLSNAVSGERDMAVMSTALGDTATSTTPIRVKSALLEVALYNSGSTPLFLELFTVQARRVIAGGSGSMDTVYSAGFTAEPAVLTGAASMTSATYGSSPFLNRQWTENWKILKKETIKLDAGQSTNITLHAGTRWITNRDQFNGDAVKVADKFTKGFFIQYYGVPNTASGQPVASSVSYNIIKTYVVENLRSAGLPNSLNALTM